jgi:hypothetical protein
VGRHALRSHRARSNVCESVRSSVKDLSAFVGIKSDRSLLDSEVRLKSFIEKLRKSSVAKHLSALNLEEDSVTTILNEARKARNEIAHELTLGLDHCLDSLLEESIRHLTDSLRTLSTRLAEGDRIVSYLVSVATNEEIPNMEFLKNYPSTVAEWVCNL